MKRTVSERDPDVRFNKTEGLSISSFFFSRITVTGHLRFSSFSSRFRLSWLFLSVRMSEQLIFNRLSSFLTPIAYRHVVKTLESLILPPCESAWAHFTSVTCYTPLSMLLSNYHVQMNRTCHLSMYATLNSIWLVSSLVHSAISTHLELTRIT